MAINRKPSPKSKKLDDILPEIIIEINSDEIGEIGWRRKRVLSIFRT